MAISGGFGIGYNHYSVGQRPGSLADGIGRFERYNTRIEFPGFRGWDIEHRPVGSFDDRQSAALGRAVNPWPVPGRVNQHVDLHLVERNPRRAYRDPYAVAFGVCR